MWDWTEMKMKQGMWKMELLIQNDSYFKIAVFFQNNIQFKLAVILKWPLSQEKLYTDGHLRLYNNANFYRNALKGKTVENK